MVAKLAFTPTNEDWLFLRILRHRTYNTILVCYIPSLFAFFLFFLLFFEDLTVLKIYRIKIYCKNNQWYFLAGFFINLWLGGFFCCIFSSKFSVNFLLPFLTVVFLIVFPLGLGILGSSYLLLLGYLTPSCVRFLNYFKEGKKHFIV